MVVRSLNAFTRRRSCSSAVMRRVTAALALSAGAATTGCSGSGATVSSGAVTIAVSGLSTPSGINLGSGWTNLFYDTFAGTSLQSWWRSYGLGNNPNGGLYDPAGVIVNNGLTIKQWIASDGLWHGPGIQTIGPGDPRNSNGTYGAKYVAVEFVATVPQADGIGPYFLFWDNYFWPPEYDIAEYPMTMPGRANQGMATSHWGAGNSNYVSTFYNLPNMSNTPHTYTAVFGPVGGTTGFYLWIDGVAQTLPSSWDSNFGSSNYEAGTSAFTFGIGTAAPGTQGSGGWYTTHPGQSAGNYGPNPLLTTVKSVWFSTHS
jgi:hypothetical protein